MEGNPAVRRELEQARVLPARALPNVTYLWCAEGVLASPLAAAVEKALASNATARNWATMLKLAALAGRS